MKKILLTLALVSGLTASAQIAEVTSVEPLLRGVESEMYYPVLSQDGTKLLYSSVNYKGLKMYDFIDNVTMKISDEERAGLDASFSVDGKSVYYVAQTWKNNRNMRQAKSFDLATKNVAAISSEGRVVMRPKALKGGVMTTVDGKVESTVKYATTVRTSGTQLFISHNGVEKAYSPVKESAGYIWESLSPDGTKVMFFAAGKGIVITDLNGNIINMLGNYEFPVWYGNDLVVAQNARDNGYQHTSSQIVIMKADGTQIQELTRPESMTMNPTASIAAGKIVYNTIDGRLYQMNITLK